MKKKKLIYLILAAINLLLAVLFLILKLAYKNPPAALFWTFRRIPIDVILAIIATIFFILYLRSGKVKKEKPSDLESNEKFDEVELNEISDNLEPTENRNHKRRKVMQNIIKTGAANYFKGGLTAVGGTLTLTTTKIIFQAHKLNVGGTANKIDLNLNQLVRVQPVGLTDLEVFDRYNTKYKFRVWGRKSWASLIEEALIQNRENDILTEGGVTLVAAANKQINEKKNMSTDSDADTLLKLKKLRFEGLITEEEYEAKRKEILKRM